MYISTVMQPNKVSVYGCDCVEERPEGIIMRMSTARRLDDVLAIGHALSAMSFTRRSDEPDAEDVGMLMARLKKERDKEQKQAKVAKETPEQRKEKAEKKAAAEAAKAAARAAAEAQKKQQRKEEKERVTKEQVEAYKAVERRKQAGSEGSGPPERKVPRQRERSEQDRIAEAKADVQKFVDDLLKRIDTEDHVVSDQTKFMLNNLMMKARYTEEEKQAYIDRIAEADAARLQRARTALEDYVNYVLNKLQNDNTFEYDKFDELTELLERTGYDPQTQYDYIEKITNAKYKAEQYNKPYDEKDKDMFEEFPED